MHGISVAEIRALLAAAAPDELARLLARHATDPRVGVQAALAAARRRHIRFQAELDRLAALASLQCSLHDRGYAVVAGIDEVGRGALAGPVTAAAVILSTETMIFGLNDSKMLTAERRRALDGEIRARALAVSVAHVSAQRIDTLGIAPATRTAMAEALMSLPIRADHVIVDGLPVALPVPATAVVKGDRRVAAVAAASIVAKVARDTLMVELDSDYPGYGFGHNRGYGSADHVAAIEAQGPCAIHRRSFGPCSQPHLF